MHPPVSIITASYNRGRYLPAMIKSVQEQTYPNWELVIVDDGSTDDTQEVVRQFLGDARIRFVKNERNCGVGATRNRALRLSRGQYVAVIDSDDVWLDRQKLTDQVQLFMSTPSLVLVGGGIQKIANEQITKHVSIPPPDDIRLRQRILIRNPFFHSTVMYVRETVAGCGGYDERLRYGEDYDLWLRLGDKGLFGALERVVAGYRMHAETVTTTLGLIPAYTTARLVWRYRHAYPRATIGLVYALVRCCYAWWCKLSGNAVRGLQTLGFRGR